MQTVTQRLPGDLLVPFLMNGLLTAMQTGLGICFEGHNVTFLTSGESNAAIEQCATVQSTFDNLF